MTVANWKYKTLEELEHEYWKNNDAPTNLVKRCFELRKVPLDNFTIEGFRLIIGQQIGLAYLIPLALEILSDNLFAEGNYYEGDLLQNVLNIDLVFWRNNKSLWQNLDQLLKNKSEQLNERKISLSKFYSINI